MHVVLAQLSELHSLPRDILGYLVTQFYGPFLQADQERLKIQTLREYRKKSSGCAYTEEEQQEFNERLEVLLTDPTMILDVRIDDGRLNDYIWLIHLHSDLITLSPLLYIPILLKGLQIDSFVAFELLWDLRKVEECKETAAFVERAIVILNDASEWDELDERCVRMIASYCLMMNLYYPVWRWLSIWPNKIKDSYQPLFPYPEPFRLLQLTKLKEEFPEPYVVPHRV